MGTGQESDDRIQAIGVHTMFFSTTLFLMSAALVFPAAAGDGTVEVGTDKRAKLQLRVCPIGGSSNIATVAERLRDDLAFSRQFDVMIKPLDAVPSREQMQQVGAPLALFVSEASNGINWWLYETLGPTMVKGRRCAKRGSLPRWWAHNVADSAWPFLTGKESSFSSKIAYCKETKGRSKNGRRTTCLCVADFDGSDEQVLLDLPTVNVAPRWNRDSCNPLLFYSQYTRNNVRLMAIDPRGKRQQVSNFDGINMCPTFCSDGSKVVYCASRNESTCQLYLHEIGKLTKLTDNKGNNIAPTFSGDGTRLYFCADFESNVPQLYELCLADRSLTRLSKTGFHASTAYCTARDLLAYTKRVGGVMQLFTYDPSTGRHAQLTSDKGDKQECAWSPCGNYLIFAAMRGGKGRITTFDLATRQQHPLTAASASTCYPSWSPLLAAPLAAKTRGA